MEALCSTQVIIIMIINFYHTNIYFRMCKTDYVLAIFEFAKLINLEAIFILLTSQVYLL